MDPIDATTLALVLDVLGPERRALTDLLASLDPDAWDRPTECPAYSVKGIATHILGDDLSLLSRQRDGAVQGLVLMAERMPGADFRALLDGFNDQWVEAARFVSPPLLIELLRLAGDWSEAFYRAVDPERPGEPVPMFDETMSSPSPYWQAIAREYLERWAHHSQIRRALGLGSLRDAPFLEVGVRVVAAAASVLVIAPDEIDGSWAIGPIVLGPAQQATDVLTLAHTADEVRALVRGPADEVDRFALRVGRRTDP